jgi:hypothetical protein
MGGVTHWFQRKSEGDGTGFRRYDSKGIWGTNNCLVSVLSHIWLGRARILEGKNNSLERVVFQQ